jgi:hypothetical protein
VFAPYQEAAPPELVEACKHAVHVLLPDGSVLRAGRAALFVLERIGFGPLARLLALPPFIWAVELGYKIVASNRRFFAEFLFTKE